MWFGWRVLFAPPHVRRISGGMTVVFTSSVDACAQWMERIREICVSCLVSDRWMRAVCGKDK